MSYILGTFQRMLVYINLNLLHLFAEILTNSSGEKTISSIWEIKIIIVQKITKSFRGKIH